MLEFVHALERLIIEDAKRTQWELGEIAKLCSCPNHEVFEYLTVALGDDLDARENISRSSLLQSLVILKEKTRPQFIMRQKQLLRQQKQAQESYHLVMDKVRIFLQKRDWYKAYRSLSYFAGNHADDLPNDLQLNLYNDCLHIGSKARANLQELGSWLRKVVEQTIQNPNNDTINEALDFFDAHQEAFLNNKLGSKLLRSIALPLKEKALTCNVPLGTFLASV